MAYKADVCHKSMSSMALELKNKAPKGSNAVLVGQALIYEVEGVDNYGLTVCAGPLGKRSNLMMVFFGKCEGEMHPTLARTSAFSIRASGGGVTLTEARELRGQLVRELHKHFSTVRLVVDNSDLELGVLNAKMFPSPAAKKILAELQVEFA